MDRMLQMIKHNKEFLDPGLIESIHIDDLMTELRPIFDALSKKITNQVEYEIQEGVVITSDKVQLKQALIQLMHNASKYTENGQIKWSVSADQNHTFFKISDSGMGMDQEKVNDVLTQLDQNDMRLIDAFSTLGLDFALIHRFCRNVHAKLICLSEPNRGTTIEIIHPLSVSIDAKAYVCVCFKASRQCIEN